VVAKTARCHNRFPSGFERDSNP